MWFENVEDANDTDADADKDERQTTVYPMRSPGAISSGELKKDWYCLLNFHKRHLYEISEPKHKYFNSD